MYTTHGHHIPGTTREESTGFVARCGGVTLCGDCSREAMLKRKPETVLACEKIVSLRYGLATHCIRPKGHTIDQHLDFFGNTKEGDSVGSAIITKTSTIMQRNELPYTAQSNFISFESLDETGFVTRTLVLPRKEVDDMGWPEQITVTIEIGDKLNPEASNG